MASFASLKTCGSKCRSKTHALELITAITRGTLPQIQLFLKTCHNPTSVSDKYGRTVLHTAASYDKCEVIEWLIEELKTDIATRDHESGWTALHRALFYGNLNAGRILISLGAGLTLRDREGLNPLDIIMKDRLPHVEFVQSGLQEVYSWGDNSNFTLGHESELRKRTGEAIDFFRKNNISVKKVSMSKYHTVFVSTEGHAYACGHGRGGRLGLGEEQTRLTPEKILLNGEEIVDVSAGKDHTVFLTEKGNIYSCGLNDYHQLGHTPQPTNSLDPKQVTSKLLKGKAIVGVCAQRYHTVLYTKDCIYTFGLNAGQLGHMRVPDESIISQPKLVSALNHKGIEIRLVTASDAATIVVTAKGDVYALHEYQCRKIVSKRLDIHQISACGGNLDHSLSMQRLKEKGGNELIVAFLSASGQIYVWFGDDQVLRRCSWVIKRSLHISIFSISPINISFVTTEGEAFIGTLPKYRSRDSAPTSIDKDVLASSPRERETFSITVSELVGKDDVIDIRIERLPFIHRATNITSDRRGLNFTVLQSQPNASLTEIPSIESSEITKHFKELMDDADLGDLIHDVVLEFGNERIAAHKYILTYRCEHFRKIFTCKDFDHFGSAVVKVENVHPDLFRELLTFIYTDTCDLITMGENVSINLDNQGLGYDSAPLSELNENIGINKDVRLDGKKTTAYAVHAKSKSKGKKGSKGQKVNNMVSSRSPTKALQEMAKKFGVKSLVKRLDAVKYNEGSIVSVPGKHLPSPAVRYDRDKYWSMYDVCILCEDGREIQAHKAVLVARMQYFRSMMGNVWRETTNTESLSLPFPSDILEVVIDFLYKDDSVVVNGCKDAEFLCNVLVLADSFLLERLKNMCEVAIASLITLKNAGELLEFASDYNASQLKRTCQQFVTINLGALLEARVLDVLSSDVMEELTVYYKENVPRMCKRKLTPYSGYPDIKALEDLESDHIDLLTDKSDMTVKREDNFAKKSKSKRRRTKSKSLSEDHDDQGSGARRKREHMTSVSSETGFSLELEEVEEDTESPTSPVESPRIKDEDESKPRIVETLKQKKWVYKKLSFPDPTMPSREQERKTAIERNRADGVVETNKESPIHNHAADDIVVREAMSPPTGGLRAIMAQEASQRASSKSTTSGAGSSKKPGKLSQKERKKMLLKQQETDDTMAEPTADTPCGTGAIPKAAWGVASNPWSSPASPGQNIQSFRDLVISEESATASKGNGIQVNPTARQHPPVTRPAKHGKPEPRTPGSGDASFSWGLSARGSKTTHTKSETEMPPQSPSSPTENPWGPVSPAPITPVVLTQSQSFSEIIREEQQQNETLARTTNKPLALIQIEEQAIAELIEHYQAIDCLDEHITVQRVPTTLATPTWAATQRQQP